MKLKICFVAQDYSKAIRYTQTKYDIDYELPDGHIIKLAKKRFECPQ